MRAHAFDSGRKWRVKKNGLRPIRRPIAGPAGGIALDYAFDADGIEDLVGGHADYWPKSEYPGGIVDYLPPEQLPEVVETMLRHGFSDDEVKGILGGNFLRVAKEVWT